ncbi:hypothetical protein [Paenibacillus prosopidis]|uniref:20S proteasome alpha/beta subunit n=1 Tax=Paenibacillus prosopidis TaxID=630520 RepID=A0A368W7V9_9BACL|nr:hypothetical protein [Paenibacillus prosopidis]RCW52060.1 20S proteasome alpha/beta subunit [Paenibacillus prosopidis]
MTLNVVVFGADGIVLASDTRLVINSKNRSTGHWVEIETFLSDNCRKVYPIPSHGMGICLRGELSINGVSITPHIEQFIQLESAISPRTVSETAGRILEYFTKLPTIPNLSLFLAGYNDNKTQSIYEIMVNNNEIKKIKDRDNIDFFGITYGGSVDILDLLFQHPSSIPWALFRIQDLIDFAVFSIRTTIQAIHFQERLKSTGGNIDILVIQPGIIWSETKFVL